ncbi:MAG: Mov34/MPN/PAD-1 family protein [Candidatus Binatia bacterium]|nr:Mov34/MPN/PAD-1 family protein [Candidatus Binatia bacterium]
MVHLRHEVWERIKEHAEATYPEECCGVVTARSGVMEVVPITNVQNELHARDPETFPRTARTAYSMRYEEVAPLLEEAYQGRLELVAFYHSHPDHEAYFSAEDRAAASGWLDDPNYARAAQIVVSVREGKVAGAKAFAWNAARQEFEATLLRIEDQ